MSHTSEKTLDSYSVFQHGDRVVVSTVLSFIGLWSSISGIIHVPALPTLQRQFGVSAADINISVVTYSIFQGITPIFTLTLADTFGRRPVLLASLVGYAAICVAISQINAFWLLLFLRCIQAASIAPVIAINLGVAGDICTPANRGGFVGIVNGTILVGNAFGGLLGSALLQRFGWRGIFVFLAIGSGTTFLFAFFTLPETHRSIVGNGLVIPKHFIFRLPYLRLPHFRHKLINDESTLAPKIKLNVFEPFKILIDTKVLSILMAASIQYASWFMALTSVSSMEKKPYNYSVIHVGLIYLPQGICGLVGPFLAGFTLNKYYKHSRDKYDLKYQNLPKLQRPPFNFYIARLTICLPLSLLVIAGLLIFGWCLHFHQSQVAIIISTLLVSFGVSSSQSAATTLLVDLYPRKGSSLTSCMNLVRCLLAALMIGVLDKMTASMGIGGCYTFMAGLCIVSNSTLIFVVYRVSKQMAVITPTSTSNLSQI